MIFEEGLLCLLDFLFGGTLVFQVLVQSIEGDVQTAKVGNVLCYGIIAIGLNARSNFEGADLLD